MEFWLTGNITEEKVAILIQEIAASTSPRIIVYINSPGGDYTASKHLHGFLCELKKEVVTAVIGECQSAAVLVLVAGAERWATPVAEFMVHQVYDSSVDDDIKKLVDSDAIGIAEYQKIIEACQKSISDCNKLSDEYYSLISAHSNLTLTKIKNKIQSSSGGDWFFNAKEALKMKVIDNIGLPEKILTPEFKASLVRGL
jgi:ATP-dependent protease ClpP protease subunit